MRHLLLNIAALLCAVSLFGGAAVYSASGLEVSEAIPTDDLRDIFEAGNNGDDFFITDLLEDNLSSLESSSNSSEDLVSSDTSSEETSSVTASAPSSSELQSSKTASSASSSSKPPSSTVQSSKPVSSAPPSSTPPSSEPVSSEPPPSSEEPPSSNASGDYDSEFLDKLAGAVQREIVGVNTPPNPKYYEAYKAQAIASHSLMENYRRLNGKYPTMSYCTPDKETVKIVSEVVNLIMYSNGKPINASYHAASGGHTQSASYVWSGELSHLKAVPSEYDIDAATTSMTISAVEEKLLNYGLTLTGEPESWFDLSSATMTDGGFVDYIPICGQMVRGRVLRENILGVTNLRSAKITDISVNGDSFYFSTMGFGHGAGMSQMGARGYSAAGWSYSDILNHYYSGISIE